jgi:polar amino acid transport system substrate-binding protein
MVMNKLEASSTLGNSCSGEVIAVSNEVHDIKIGDQVACAGEGAWHADVVAVNRNLCVKIPGKNDLKQAAFAGIAAIAIQGVRQADLRLSEKAVVIGLGLIGRLVIQVLKAAGVDVIGVDSDKARVNALAGLKTVTALNFLDPELENIVSEFSQGNGVDAVIIAADSTSTDPVNLAGLLCRQRGKVVVIGKVATGFDRKPYFRKELDLRMSCGYGPGSHDPLYEIRGLDYPIGYVRWTENRNLQSYIELLNNKKLQVDQLISHTVTLVDTPEIYTMILNRSDPFCGVVIDYDSEKELSKKVTLKEKPTDPVDPAVGFVGAGVFARSTILPIIRKHCNLVGVITARSHNARQVADKYGFAYSTGNADEIIADDRINTVFITTRNDLHAEFVIKALTMSKHVFVEKPLAMTKDDLKRIWETHRLLVNRSQPLPVLMAGFNRRFAPFIKKAKELFPLEQPKAIHYRINAMKFPKDHWVHDPEIGGGVIISEVCQFVDLAIFLSGGEVSSISAKSLRDPDHLQDNLVISLGFDNGSIATISYYSNGHKRLPAEYLEIFCSGQSVIINDFKSMKIYGNKVSSSRLRRPDRGHQQELLAFFNAIQTGSHSPIPFDELYASSLATFAVQDSIKR